MAETTSIQRDNVSTSFLDPLYIMPIPSITEHQVYEQRSLHADLMCLVDEFSRQYTLSSHDFYTPPAPNHRPALTTHDDMILTTSSSCATFLHARNYEPQPVTSSRPYRQLSLQIHRCVAHGRAVESLFESMIHTRTQCRLWPSLRPASLRPHACSSSRSRSRSCVASFAPTRNPNTPTPAASSTTMSLGLDDSPPSSCNFSPDSSHPPSPMSSAPLRADEGFYELDDISAIELALSRRSESPTAIIRKTLSTYRRSNDYALALHSQGKCVVRSKPRMRRRVE